jgi:hypothetical protein
MLSEWGLFSESGGEAVTFDSFIDIEIKNQGKVLTEPIEEGGFMAYNKVESPLEVRVTLGTNGPSYKIESTLSSLKDLKIGTDKLTVSTPFGTYDSMTLESFDYQHANDNGANALMVECVLREVREVETNVSTEASMSENSSKNPSSASKKGTGKAETTSTSKPKETQKEPKKSILAEKLNKK